MTNSKTMQDYIAPVEAALEKYLSDSRIHPTLAEAMRYSGLKAGKRFRPVLCLAACEMAGGNIEDAVPFASAIEMIHTYSLIHDDLPAMDNDVLRRGKPTSHVVYGEGMAILAGDGLLSHAFSVMLDAVTGADDTRKMARAARAIADRSGAFGMVSGQAEDLKTDGEKTAERLNYIHEKKTADMIVGSILAGSIIGGASEAMEMRLEVYGKHLGLAFQIRDDILDVTGKQDEIGKSVGKDARDGKLTFVSMYGLGGAQEKLVASIELAVAALESYCEKAEFLIGLARSLMPV